MRPKGWRLDPAWIAHYERIERARREREVELLRAEWQAAKVSRAIEEMRRPISRGPSYF